MELTGNILHTALALSLLDSINCDNNCCASSNNCCASLPYISSCRIAGYFPFNSQERKKGDQSIYAEISWREISSKTQIWVHSKGSSLSHALHISIDTFK